MAWIGIRPEATSWPPARRAAEANGAAHVFSHTSTPAVLPFSIASARWATSSAARISAISPSNARSSSTSSRSSISNASIVPSSSLCRISRSSSPNRAGLDERGQLGRHLPGEVALPSRKLHDEVVHRTQLVDVGVAHRTLLPGRSEILPPRVGAFTGHCRALVAVGHHLNRMIDSAPRSRVRRRSRRAPVTGSAPLVPTRRVLSIPVKPTLRQTPRGVRRR